jgi:sec-independent protein translocase protein TatA
MFGLGMGELLVILLIVVLIFGVGKLPQLGDGLGRAIRNFKHAASGENQIEVNKKKEIAAGSATDDAEADVASRKVVDKKRT